MGGSAGGAPDRWLVLTVAVGEEAERHELIDALVALGGAAVEERPEGLVTYLRPPADGDTGALLESAAAALEAAAGRAVALDWSWRDHEDWAERWRRGLGPRRVGRRLVVTPPWVEPPPEPEREVLVIDPAMAFGTGEHGTTRGALRLLEPVVPRGGRVLDVGAGSAILAIAAARLGAADVLAIESDPDAIGTAAENIARNAVVDRVALRCETVTAATLAALPTPVDLILANILSGVLVPLLGAFAEALAPGGRLVTAGVLARERAAFLDAATAAGLALEAEDREDEWWSARFVAVRPEDGGPAADGPQQPDAQA